MHNLKFILMTTVSWEIPHQRVSELTPITGEATDTNGDNIKVVAFVIAATGVAFGCASLLQLNLRLLTIAYSLDLNSYGHARKRYNGKVMHSIHIMAFVAVQPTFPAGDAEFPLKMDLAHSTLQRNLQAKSLVDCIEQFLGS